MAIMDDNMRLSAERHAAPSTEDPRTHDSGGQPQLLRCALDQLNTARERVAEYLDRPASVRMVAAQHAVQRFVHFESFEIVDSGALVDVDPESARGLFEGHHHLEVALNRLVWSTPGTHQGSVEAHEVRRQLLRQIDRYVELLGTGTGVGAVR